MGRGREYIEANQSFATRGGHLRARVAHLFGQAVDGFGHRLHGRRVFVGVHLRESITAGTRSALTPKSVLSTETNPNLSHGQFLRGLSP